MKILMLGWEFPPHISGGLGTACQGIVGGLGKMPDTKVIFVVPKVFGDEKSKNTVFAGANKYVEKFTTILDRKVRKVSGTDLIYVETASFLHPYMTAEDIEKILVKKHIDPSTVEFDSSGKMLAEHNGKMREVKLSFQDLQSAEPAKAAEPAKPKKFEFTGKYTENLYTETGMFARVAEKIAEQYDFDVIHAHDWLTYEAGIAIKEASQKPLVVHVHATEFDRSGGYVNERVFNIEKHGMQEADAVVTVSNLTKDIVVDKYGIDEDKIHTVYNAVDFRPDKKKYKKPKGEKIVTFLGRITHQKGPLYFLEAAYKVLQRVDNVRFVMAGNGDMYRAMIREAARLGIADKFHFTDFLNRDEVKHLFAISDVYVMPSVSEPFGIAPLEAVKSNVPVIISNQSGVSEVLKHALKVDYWDINSMADAIYGLVKYPALSKFFKTEGRNEVNKMKWTAVAENLSDIYREVVESRADEDKDDGKLLDIKITELDKNNNNDEKLPEL